MKGNHLLSLILLCVIFISVESLTVDSCSDPQKTAYLSFNFLSKRDTISNLFNQTNAEMIRYDFAYTDPQSNKVYNISQLRPQLYYNEHYQLDQFVNEQKSKVRLGQIEYAFGFDYEISKNGASIQKGTAHGRKVADEIYFVKSLMLKQASLQWQLSESQPIIVTADIPIDFSNPKLDHSDLMIFQEMVNDKVGSRGLKEKIFASFNAYYSTNLIKHLNNQHLFNNTKVTYTYKNLTLEYIHLARDPKLVNNPGSTQGLVCTFTFEIAGRQQKCSKLPPDFAKTQGGAQQLISMQTLKQSLIAALQHGVFDVTLDSKWQVKQFQFFMGDLSNVVKNGTKYLPKQPIYGTGKFNRTEQFNIVFTSYAIDQISIQIPYTVTLTSDSQELLKINFILIAVVKLTALDDSLQVQMVQAVTNKEIFTAINSDFQVTNELLAKEYLRVILKGLQGTKTFGTGWPLISRRFPSVIVRDNYVMINDYSEL